MMLTKTDIKLLVPLLKRAAEEFSNHGCNDFNLDEYLTEEERSLFIAEVNAIPNFGSEPFDDHKYALPDWLVMEALVKKLEKEQEPPSESGFEDDPRTGAKLRRPRG